MFNKKENIRKYQYKGVIITYYRVYQKYSKNDFQANAPDNYIQNYQISLIDTMTNEKIDIKSNYSHDIKSAIDYGLQNGGYSEMCNLHCHSKVIDHILGMRMINKINNNALKGFEGYSK